MMTQAAQSALRRGQLPPSLSLTLHLESDSLTRILSECSTVIEQYTKNVRFCIICNYVNKIIPAIQSRCTRFRCPSLFSLLTSEPLTNWSKGWWFVQVRTFTKNWSWETFTTCHRRWKVRSSCSPITSPPKADRCGVAEYSCQITQDGRQALLKLSRGDMRRALNVLQVSFFFSPPLRLSSLTPHSPVRSGSN